MDGRDDELGVQAAREARQRSDFAALLTIVRHGEPDWETYEQVPEGPVLTRRGRLQAEAAGAALSESSYDALFASPLRRARQTAEAVGAAIGLEPEIADGLEEIRIRPDLTQEEVDRYFTEAIARPLDQHWEGWPESGETFREFHTRVTEELARILGRFGIEATPHGEFTIWSPPSERRSIVLAAHGGTNAALVTHLLDIAPVPWEWLRFESELASYSVLALRAIGSDRYVWSLQNFNEVDHLRKNGLR